MFNKYNRMKLFLIFSNVLLVLLLILLMVYINLPYNFINTHYKLAEITNSNYIPNEYSCDNTDIGKYLSLEDRENIYNHCIYLTEENGYSYEGFINDELFVVTDQSGEYTFKSSTFYPIDEYDSNEIEGVESYGIAKMDIYSMNNSLTPYTIEEDLYPTQDDGIGGRYEVDSDGITIEMENLLESGYLLVPYKNRFLNPSNYPEDDKNKVYEKYQSSTFTIEKV